MQDSKDRFNEIALGVITHLETLPDVIGIEFSSSGCVSSHEFSVFQKRHNVTLPADLKAFYSIFNGVSLKWSACLGTKSFVVGDIRVNKFEEIVASPIIDNNLLHIKPSPSSRRPDGPDGRTCMAFSIDSHSDVGTIYLLFRTANRSYVSESSEMHSNSEIWLQDISMRWFFICSTVTQYLRLMIMHLGIVGWQLAFTPEGLCDYCCQWMDIFCKDRLCIDLHQRNLAGWETN